jgi:hypothetical protein
VFYCTRDIEGKTVGDTMNIIEDGTEITKYKCCTKAFYVLPVKECYG